MKTLKTITRNLEAKIGLSLFFLSLLIALLFIAELKNTIEHVAMFLMFTLPFLISSIFFIVLAIEETIKETNK